MGSIVRRLRRRAGWREWDRLGLPGSLGVHTPEYAEVAGRLRVHTATGDDVTGRTVAITRGGVATLLALDHDGNTMRTIAGEPVTAARPGCWVEWLPVGWGPSSPPWRALLAAWCVVVGHTFDSSMIVGPWCHSTTCGRCGRAHLTRGEGARERSWLHADRVSRSLWRRVQGWVRRRRAERAWGRDPGWRRWRALALVEAIEDRGHEVGDHDVDHIANTVLASPDDVRRWMKERP